MTSMPVTLVEDLLPDTPENRDAQARAMARAAEVAPMVLDENFERELLAPDDDLPITVGKLKAPQSAEMVEA